MGQRCCWEKYIYCPPNVLICPENYLLSIPLPCWLGSDKRWINPSILFILFNLLLFVRRIFDFHTSVPKESLYIESVSIPLKYIITVRRLMYWWNILHLHKSELLYKFCTVQQLSIDHGDGVRRLEWMQLR